MIKKIILFGTLIVLLCAFGYSHYSREIYYKSHLIDLTTQLSNAKMLGRIFEKKSKRLTRKVTELKKEIKIRDEIIKELSNKLVKERKLLVHKEDSI